MPWRPSGNVIGSISKQFLLKQRRKAIRGRQYTEDRLAIDVPGCDVLAGEVVEERIDLVWIGIEGLEDVRTLDQISDG
jgi:hypothetical protein